MNKLKKLNIIIAVLFLLLTPFALISCKKENFEYKFERTNTDFKTGSYSDFVTKHYGTVTFTLTNITEETLDIKVVVGFGIKKDNIISYKSKEQESLAFAPGESRDFSFSISDLINTPVSTYKIEIFKL